MRQYIILHKPLIVKECQIELELENLFPLLCKDEAPPPSLGKRGVLVTDLFGDDKKQHSR